MKGMYQVLTMIVNLLLYFTFGLVLGCYIISLYYRKKEQRNTIGFLSIDICGIGCVYKYNYILILDYVNSIHFYILKGHID